MINKHIHPALNWFKHVVTEPRHELSRWQTAVRYAYDMAIHGWKALNRDNAPQMAAALAFRSLFALLPVVVVSTVVVRAVRGEEGFYALIHRMITALNLHKVPFGTSDNLGHWLETLVGGATGINLAALGWVGLVVVVYSAISLLVTIENSFNAIYGTTVGRSWTRRVPMYWLLLTMSPVFIGMMLYLSSQFTRMVESVETMRWALSIASYVWSFAVTWLFMVMVYMLVPSTKVLARAALAGGFVAAALLTIGKSSLNAYFNNAISLESLYGSLGAVPLFMFWVYMMWLVVLFGLEVSATVQALQGRPLEELEQKRPQNGLVDPAAVLAVMELVNERFAASQTAQLREIADETFIPEGIVAQIIDRLVNAGLLHRLEKGDGAVSLACPPEHIAADRLIEIGYSLVDEGGVGRQSALIQRLRAAQTSLAHQATLASLLAPNGVPKAPSQVLAQ